MPPTDVIDPPQQPPTPLGPQPGGVEVVGYDRYVDDRIRRTRRMVKVIDVAHVLLALAVGWVAFVVISAMFEHWVIRGGFTESGRYILFSAAIVASLGLMTVRLLPILTRRVNPLYAADAIEQTTPSLKNTLVNLLQLRRDSRAPAALSKELEREAAERIALLDGDVSVDRQGLIRLGWLLIGLLVALIGYAMLSPKNPFATAARVLAPWADIAAPTRVRILEVGPGNAEIAQGNFATITARIRDLAPDEQAWLVTSTADRQQREKRVPLQTIDDTRFELRLPVGGTLGLQQDVAYRIEAGDARSRRYRLRVVTAPSIVVRNIHYDYPDYTRYLDRDAPNAGDLRAIEGTRVRIDAAANLPIDTAQVDLNADGRPDLRMATNQPLETQWTASASFTLGLRDDRRTPKHNAYALRLTTADGRTNTDPIAHRIEVVADRAPEVEMIEPKEPVRDVRVNETVAMRFWARDPDFGLASLEVRGIRAGRGVGQAGGAAFSKRLITQRTEGRFEGVFRFRPSDHGLKPGDVVDYTAIATDVKQPGPQLASTPLQRFRIVAGAPQDQAGKNPADREQNNQNQQPSDDGQEPGDEQSDPKQGDGQQDSQDGQSGADSQDSAGGDNRQPGADDVTQQQGNQQQDPQANEQPGDEQQGGPQRGDQQQGDQQQSPDASQQNGGEQEKEKSSGKDNGAGGIKGEETEGNGDASQDNQSSGGGNGSSQARDPSESSENNSGGEGGRSRSGGGNNRGQNQRRQGDGQGGGDRRSAADQRGTRGDSADQTPVAKDGENDGEAFDRIKEFLDKQEGERGKPKNAREPADGQASPDDARNADQQTPDQRDLSSGDPSSKAEGRADGEAADRSAEESGAKTENSPTLDNNSREQSDALGADDPQSEGGGEKGRGEQAPRDGTGSAGETNAADDGQGRAADRGAGDTAKSGGDRQASDQPTGKPGQDQPGNGSTERESSRGDRGDGAGEQSADNESGGNQPGGEQAGEGQQRADEGPSNSAAEQRGSPNGASPNNAEGQGADASADNRDTRPGERGPSDNGAKQTNNPGEQPQSEPGQSGETDQQSKDTSRQQDRDADSKNDGKGVQPGGGRGARPGEQREGKTPAGDKANLDYTRKQTDLILDELSEQLRKRNVDRELLDKLGWTEADLRRFVDRWQTKKTDARKSTKARAELDEDLRSLGLSRRRLDGRVNRAADNVRVGAGYRSKTPAAIRDRLRAYNAGVSRGSEENNAR